ncbi:MAG: DUF2334 domain-containing protein [Candidatus Aminicenantes bacterium]|nr:DUF2334 domain-containing protein [Candidatus Aminicenantes bacterium]
MKKGNFYRHIKQMKAFLFLCFIFFIFAAPNMRSASSRPPKTRLKTIPEKKMQIVILKADDFVFSAPWVRFITYIEDKGIKASLGVVGEKLEDESFCEWIKKLSMKDNYEFWNHGVTHSCIRNVNEFKGMPYEDQFIYLAETQGLLKEKCGITCHTFGAPCNQVDENTSRALEEVDDIDVWYFGNRNSSKLFLQRKGEIEYPTLVPNYNYFLEKYNEYRLAEYECITLQIHPGFWNDENWQNFLMIMDFLSQKKVVFMNPYEYFQSITRTITVTNAGNSGRGSLRAAITQANTKKLKKTVIILPSGTYNLSGRKDEDNKTRSELVVASNIEIRGAGAADTIIDGNHNGRVFLIHSGNFYLSGVTIRNGSANYGAGIRVDGGVFTIKDCIITGNSFIDKEKTGSGGGGVGIYARNAKVTITGCKITGNIGNSPGSIKGGGAWIDFPNTSKHVDIRNNLIQENLANKNPSGTGQGGGLYLLAKNPGGGVAIFNNTFRGNIAGAFGPGEGGGVYFREVGDVVLERNRFCENAASVKGQKNGRGGAIFAAGGVALTMTNNLLVNNHAGMKGCGIYLGDPGSGQTKAVVCNMINNTLANNNLGIAGNGGEGIYVGDDVTLNLINNIITGHAGGINRPGAAAAGRITMEANLFYNAGDPVLGANALVRDPRLNSEFKPLEDSPVVDAGKTFLPVTKDLEGIARPQGNGYDIGCYEYLSPPEPAISLNRPRLNFAGGGGHVTGNQSVRISNSGAGILNWTAEPGKPWIQVNPSCKSGTGVVTVAVDPRGLPPGPHTGTVFITDANAPNSPQIVNVNLTVYPPGLTGVPFGGFTTPGDGAVGVTGSIPITGWALDDIQVDRVELYNKQGETLVFIGAGVFVEGARPDEEQAYPNYPFNYRAGWGYLLLSDFLPGQGNGVFTITAVAVDKEGNRVTLGAKTIACDNTHAGKPFGALDTPTQEGIASGRNYVNWGWVLTPKPNKIPIDGSAINIWVDGVHIGHPIYNIYRRDIASLFPGYANSSGAVGYSILDTTSYADGVHTIQWGVRDSAGNSAVIGSRCFIIQNSQGSWRMARGAGVGRGGPTWSSDSDPVDDGGPVKIKKGYNPDSEPELIYPGDNGTITIEIRELDRIEIHFNNDAEDNANDLEKAAIYNFSPLPVGSTLDMKKGIFYWLPGPGFVGDYHFVFVEKWKNGEVCRKVIIVRILPRNV